MALTTLDDVLAAARQLPRKAQAKLVETLLREGGAPTVELMSAKALYTLALVDQASTPAARP